MFLAAIHGELGNKGEAQRALDRARALDASALQDPKAWLLLHNAPENFIGQVIDGLRKAGLHAPNARATPSGR